MESLPEIVTITAPPPNMYARLKSMDGDFCYWPVIAIALLEDEVRWTEPLFMDGEGTSYTVEEVSGFDSFVFLPMPPSYWIEKKK